MIQDNEHLIIWLRALPGRHYAGKSGIIPAKLRERMRHRKLKSRLGRTTAHRKALMANMSTALFRQERIVTTFAKAKALRSDAEKLITLGKRGDIHTRRQVMKVITDKKVVKKLFDDLVTRFSDRNGGYTRVMRLTPRRGDGADMAIIELVDFAERKRESEVVQEKTKAKKQKKAKVEKPATAKTDKPEKVKAEKPEKAKAEKPKKAKAAKPEKPEKPEKAKAEKPKDTDS